MKCITPGSGNSTPDISWYRRRILFFLNWRITINTKDWNIFIFHQTFSKQNVCCSPEKISCTNLGNPLEECRLATHSLGPPDLSLIPTLTSVQVNRVKVGMWWLANPFKDLNWSYSSLFATNGWPCIARHKMKRVHLFWCWFQRVNI